MIGFVIYKGTAFIAPMGAMVIDMLWVLFVLFICSLFFYYFHITTIKVLLWYDLAVASFMGYESVCVILRLIVNLIFATDMRLIVDDILRLIFNFIFATDMRLIVDLIFATDMRLIVDLEHDLLCNTWVIEMSTCHGLVLERSFFIYFSLICAISERMWWGSREPGGLG